MGTPWFFQRLRIAPGADAKVIKRAYAAALKAVDQQHEREAFETLRRAYEQALAWAVQHKEDDADDAPGEDRDKDTGDKHTGDEDAGDQDGGEWWMDGGSEWRLDGRVPDSEQEAAASDRIAAVLSDVLGLAAAPDAPDIGASGAARPPSLDTEEAQARAAARKDFLARHAAVREWIVRLLDPRGERVDALLERALDDERMAHLDSRLQFEGCVADALYDAPDGRTDLFDAASLRFGWASRHDRPGGSADAARWIVRVLDQDLLWRQQRYAIRSGQAAALKAAARTDTPSGLQMYRFALPLTVMQAKYPDWLALRLPAGRLAGWPLERSWLVRLQRRLRRPVLRKALGTKAFLILIAISSIYQVAGHYYTALLH